MAADLAGDLVAGLGTCGKMADVATPGWRQYEQDITRLLEDRASGPVEILPNARIQGVLSGAMRQVDILVRGRFAGITHAVMAVDCKCYASKVDVKDVESFLAMLDDLDVGLGMMVTTVGFSEAAQRRTQRISREVIPLVNIAMLDEASTWWLMSARAAGTYSTETVDHTPYGKSWRLLSFNSLEDDNGDFETDVLWSSVEEDWDREDLGRTLAQLVLRHHLGRNPRLDEVEAVESAIEPLLDGDDFTFGGDRVDEWLLA